MNYSLRRKKLFERMLDNSVAVLFAGEEVVCNADQFYPFAVNNNFYYLTGIKQKQSILVLKKIRNVVSEEMYVLNFDPLQARWIGKYLSFDEVSRTANMAVVKGLDSFITDLAITIKNRQIENIYLDLEHAKSDVYQGSTFRSYITSHHPELTIKNCFMDVAILRSIKEEEEINCIRQAIAYTKLGLDQVRAGLKSGYYEYQMEAIFNYSLASNGVAGAAFQTIAASGKNATVLHYVDNNCIIPDNSLMLFDLGAKYQGYSADISRTYPVGGKFDDKQRILYQTVLNGQKVVLDAVKPGISCNQLNDILKEYYVSALTQLGLINNATELERYYWHGVSHSLGLDTHDVGLLKDAPLVAGNVITVEPGLYLEEFGIGIRIEDDVLVTANGCDVLSIDIAKEIADLEAH